MSSSTISQSGRWLTVTSPLGADDLIATDLRGSERFSTPYLFVVDCLTPLDEIGPEQLLGKHVSVRIDAHEKDGPRHFGGIVRAMEPGTARVRGYRSYRLELVPQLWLLSLGSDLRIFQEMSALEVVEEIFKDHGLTDYTTSGVTGSPPERTYCVQYRETHLDFASRLLEEEGIFYYFEFQEDKHILKLADSTAAYAAAGRDYVFGASANYDIETWSPRLQQRSGKWTLKHYDFEQPAVVTGTADTVITTPSFSTEVYDYPGKFVQKARGDKLAEFRATAHEAGHETIDGTGRVPALTPAHSFALEDKSSSELTGTEVVVVGVEHHAIDHTQMIGMGGAEDYSNSFTCIPAARLFRPERRTPRPVVEGPHTAVVVGPQGEEIHSDKHGRVKVQFHWDRLGQSDDKSSCWIRVAQAMAGKNWGSIFLPRIGMEVVVEFLEGDPDRPLITGCLFNGANPPPYALPTNQTQSGFKSRSSKGGGTEDFNELRFEDKAGSEQVYFHAQKDFERYVEDADTLTVEQGDRTVTLEQGSETVTIQQGDQTVKIDQGNQGTTLGQGDHTLKMSAGQSTTDAAQKITLKVGSSTVVVEPAKISLDSAQIVCTGTASIKLSAPMVEINGNAMVKLQGGIVKIN